MWAGWWVRYCKSFNAVGIYLMLAGTTLAHSFGMQRVGLLASRAMIRVPLKAAAGRATAVKLQSNRESKFWGHVFLHVDRVHNVKESRFSSACMKPA